LRWLLIFSSNNIFPEQAIWHQLYSFSFFRSKGLIKIFRKKYQWSTKSYKSIYNFFVNYFIIDAYIHHIAFIEGAWNGSSTTLKFSRWCLDNLNLSETSKWWQFPNLHQTYVYMTGLRDTIKTSICIVQ
jgi:hypothetical protein